MSIKNSNYTIGNRTHDLPACSAVLQPTAPPRALEGRIILKWMFKKWDEGAWTGLIWLWTGRPYYINATVKVQTPVAVRSKA
jgi:hypothetical protein